jgi:DNA-binding NarL/FixJ family response regulator
MPYERGRASVRLALVGRGAGVTRDAAVLVVDDDEGLRALVRDALEQAGYTALEAATHDEALRRAREHSPDLVVTDVEMAGGSGYEVCRTLREEFGAELPIIILSGSRTEAHDRVAGFEFGADDYIVKPFDPAELRARVRALLRRSRRRAHSAPAAKGSGLTPRELEILDLLAAGLNQAEIARRLVVSPKTVSKHIERILAKLGVRSRAEAVARAYRDGLIEAE